MSVQRNQAKRILAIALLACISALAVGVLLLAGRVQEETGAGADPSTALTEVPDRAEGLEGIVTWAPDGPLQERTVEPSTRRAVEAAWTRSWEALHRASNGDPSLLETWFVGGALAQVRTTYSDGTGTSELELGDHVLRVVFYSDDGSIIGLEADPVEITRRVDVDGVDRRLTSVARIDVVLTLEDGNWRIRQWLRGDVDLRLF